MKIFKKIAALAVIATLSTSAFAGVHGNGESPESALSTEQEMKAAVHLNIGQLRMRDFNLSDCSVNVTYTVDAEGKVTVKEVYGNSSIATEYVKARLENKKMYVSPELQGVKHRTSIRFVLI